MGKKDQIVRTTIRMPQELWDMARHRAIDENLSLQDLVRIALEKYVGYSAKGGKR
jgi:hypothetical protein